MHTLIKKIVCLSFIIALSACASEQEQEGGSEIAQICEADGVSISKGFESSTEKESIDYVGIEIDHPKSLYGRQTSPLALAKVAALTMYRKLSEETKKEKNAIKVKINISDKNGEQEFTHVVLFEELKKIDQSVKVYHQFSECVKEEKYDKAYDFFDSTLTQQMPKDTLMYMMQRLSTNPLKITQHHLTSYETIPLNDGGKEIEVISIEGVYMKDTLANPVKYQLNTQNKIVGFNF